MAAVSHVPINAGFSAASQSMEVPKPEVVLLEKVLSLFAPAIQRQEELSSEIRSLKASKQNASPTFQMTCKEYLNIAYQSIDVMEEFDATFEKILSLPTDQAKQTLSAILFDLAKKNQFQLYQYVSGKISREASDEILYINESLVWEDLHTTIPMSADAIAFGSQEYWAKKAAKHPDTYTCILNDPAALQHALLAATHQRIAYICYMGSNPHTIPIFFEREGNAVSAIITDSIIDFKCEGENEDLIYISSQQIAIDSIKDELIPAALGLEVAIYRFPTIPEQSSSYGCMVNELTRQTDCYNCSLFALHDLYTCFRLSAEGKLWQQLAWTQKSPSAERVVSAYPEKLIRPWQSLKKIAALAPSSQKKKDIGISVIKEDVFDEDGSRFAAKKINVYIQRQRHKLQALLLGAC